MSTMFSSKVDEMLLEKLDYLRRQNQPYVYPAEQRRDVALYTNPHWTDERFTKQDQVVFGTDAHTPGVKVKYADHQQANTRRHQSPSTRTKSDGKSTASLLSSAATVQTLRRLKRHSNGVWVKMPWL